MNNTTRPTLNSPLQRLYPILAVTLVFITFLSSLNGTFIFDDIHMLNTAAALLHGWHQGHIILTKRILADVTFVFDYWRSAAHDLHPAYFHMTNILIHGASVWVLFALVATTVDRISSRRRVPLDSRLMAFWIAAVWGVHPLTTAAVSYIAQRYESLMSLFFLLALLVGAKSLNSPGKRWYVMMAVCSGFGGAAKEIMIMCPLVLALYDWSFGPFFTLREQIERRWKMYAASSMAIWVLVATSNLPLLSDPSSFSYVSTAMSPAHYAMTEAGVILHYISLALVPHGLCFDYDWPDSSHAHAIASLIGLLPYLIVTLIAIRRRSPAGFALGAFFIILAPTSSVLARPDVIVEHRMYLPLAALLATIACVAYSLSRYIPGARKVGTALGCVLILVLARATVARNEIFVTDQTVWESVLKSYPNSARAHVGLGTSFQVAGLNEKARREFGTVLALIGQSPRPWSSRLRTDYAEAINNLGVILVNEQRYVEAQQLFQRGLTETPTSTDLLRNLREINGYLQRQPASGGPDGTQPADPSR